MARGGNGLHRPPEQTSGLNQDDIINKWQQYGPNSGVSREQYEAASKAKQDAINAERQAAIDAADAERKRFEDEQAAIAAQMQQEQTLLANANGLAANSQSDNASYINTGGGSTISSKLMLGDENIKRRKGGGTVSASLGL